MFKKMFKKREETDEIELGAELYLKGLKESKQALAKQITWTEPPKEPETSMTEPSKDIPEGQRSLIGYIS